MATGNYPLPGYERLLLPLATFVRRVCSAVLLILFVLMLLLVLVFHCHIIYSSVVEGLSKNETDSVNGTAHDYPDYEPIWKQEPTENIRNIDYESFPTNPTRRYPQLVTVPDFQLERTQLPPPAVMGTDYGIPSGYGSEMGDFRRRNQMIMGNPRMRLRPMPIFRNNVPYPQYQNGYSSLGYSYAGYIERQARRFPIMMYTLVQCVPCQRAKHLLAVSYSDAAAHFLELVGGEDWQRQLRADLHRMTGQETFPYIFICGSHIGGASNLFELHQSGQLRTMLNNCTPRQK